MYTAWCLIKKYHTYKDTETYNQKGKSVNQNWSRIDKVLQVVDKVIKTIITNNIQIKYHIRKN